jgi:hypothetical protein
MALACSDGLAAGQIRFSLTADPMLVVTDEKVFRPLAEHVRAEVERLLGVPAAVDDPATFKLLLSTRVHLAHHFGDNGVAVATAAWIRSLQTDPDVRAFAGLTTLASVEARRRNPGMTPDEARYRATFFNEFTRQLAELPRRSGTVAMLRGQREKIAAITEAALLAETREVIVPALRRKGYCGLEEADQLVRVRHRLVSIVPVRDETLRALDAAIAARSSP